MDVVKCRKIHDVVVDFLKVDDKSKLDVELIGEWYFTFLNSEKKDLTLVVPFYNKQFTLLAYQYVRCFHVVFETVKNKNPIIYKEACLFDVFKDSASLSIVDYQLNYIGKKENIAKWGDGTLTKLNSFFPVFENQPLKDFGSVNKIKNSFGLFKGIKKNKLVKGPVLIDVENKLLTFNNLKQDVDNIISEREVNIDTKLSRKESIDLYKECKGEYQNSFWIKYPYSLKPIDPLTRLGEKKFRLVFKNRLAYKPKDIKDNEIILLRDESERKWNVNLDIIDTNHSIELFKLFQCLKEEWSQLELNRYATPYPKYWLLFVNASIPANEWLKQFEIDFPAIARKPIIKTIEKILLELVKLDWINPVLSDGLTMCFPELKSNRKKRLEKVFKNFVNYVNSFDLKIEVVSIIDNHNQGKILALDSFDIIELVNRYSSLRDIGASVTIPDFLYYGYQPWLKYHYLNYQTKPLLAGLRESLDKEYPNNEIWIKELKDNLIKDLKVDLNKYKEKYKEVDKENVIIEEELNEEIEFTNEEEVENLPEIIVDENLRINNGLDSEFEIKTIEEIYLIKDSVLLVQAGCINKGDYVLQKVTLRDMFESIEFYDKLANTPKSVENFQSELSQTENIYNILVKRGLSLIDEKYFNNNYARDSESCEFIIPRRKNDWSIICDYLNISETDKQLSFIEYYGRKKKNELIKMYKSILNALIQNNWIGCCDNPDAILCVSDIVEKNINIFNEVEDFSSVQESKNIINLILSQLDFIEVESIKTIANE